MLNRVSTAVMCLGLMAAPVLNAQVNVINPKMEHGAAVEAKVRQMIASNPHLREAIARLEARGLKSHPEAATVISGIAVRSASHVATGALSVGATATVSGDDVEITFIPNTYYYGYWDGTVDAKRYDSSGNLIDEYIGNVTGESADPSQGLDCTYEDPTYSYDSGGCYGDCGGGGDIQPVLQESVGPARGAQPHPANGRHGDDARASRVGVERWLGHWGGWAKCSGAWCGGAAAGCGVANAIDAEVGWLPCTAAGCIGGAIGCTYGTLWD